MTLYKILATNNECYQRAVAIKPCGIMVHSTGANNPNLKRYVQPDNGMIGVNNAGNHFNTYRPGGRQVCVHAFIGKDKNGNIATCQTLPWNYRGWHSGVGRKGSANNMGYIGFEICEDGLTDSNYFNKVYKEAVELTAYLCKLYNLDPSKDGVVICHSEGHTRGIASNHSDVMHWFPKHGKNMDMFRADVVNALKTGSFEEDDDMSIEDLLKNITDEQAYQLLMKAANYQSSLAEPQWSINEGAWAVAEAKKIVADGAPERYVKRDEMIAILSRMGLLK